MPGGTDRVGALYHGGRPSPRWAVRQTLRAPPRDHRPHGALDPLRDYGSSEQLGQEMIAEEACDAPW